MKQVEVIFDEKTGKFVVHFLGFATHEEEHKMLDKILANLRKQGFDASVEHYHDKPKLPELRASTKIDPNQTGGSHE